jgi:hypothetical protein
MLLSSPVRRGGLKAQHGSLTMKDSLVQVAFAYPSVSGPTDKDDTMKYLFQLFGTGKEQIEKPIEAEALRRFFIGPEGCVAQSANN